ncbi:hypothetical protein [Streptomyces omiyaensis]|uniref:Uncharacterized protein n=1 Tax=Streptomyces omiyaensis TaxID=68247 RepID=A0ABW7C5P3_9ACTN
MTTATGDGTRNTGIRNSGTRNSGTRNTGTRNSDSATTTRTDPTWWKAPLGVTLPGLPLLVGQFAFFGGGHTSGLDVTRGIAAVLLVLCWLPPHRRSFRGGG